jgi:hypothetical protein
MSGWLLPKDDLEPGFGLRVWTVVRDVAILGLVGTAVYLVWDMRSVVGAASRDIQQSLKTVNITAVAACIEKICRVI